MRTAGRLIQTGMLSIGFVLLVLGYNNCSPEHKGETDIKNGLGQFKSCAELDEISLFQATYHNFLKNKCAACHVEGGVGPGSFASSGPFLAWESFTILGPSYIDERALDGHSSASGGFNQAAIDQVSQDYLEGLRLLNSCQEGGAYGDLDQNQDGEDRLQTKVKGINPQLGRSTNVTFDLGRDVLPQDGFDPSLFRNVRLTFTVGLLENPSGVVYLISNPSLSSPVENIRIKSLLVKVNGKAQRAQAAFYHIDTTVRAWNDQHPNFGDEEARRLNNLLDGGTLVVEQLVQTSDVISLSIGGLEVNRDLPPIAEAPKVNFASQSDIVTIEDNIDADGFVQDYRLVEVKVETEEILDTMGIFEVSFGPDTSANLRDECCMTGVVNRDGDSIEPLHFDRDIELANSNGDKTGYGRIGSLGDTDEDGNPRNAFRFTISPGENSVSFFFRIVPDSRVEGTETIHLQLKRLFNLTQGDRSDLHIQIQDDPRDQAPPQGVQTFAQLMSPNGLLREKCLRCHNSVDFRGGYDMTDYWGMIESGVILIPFSPSSMIYARMNPDDPIYDNANEPLLPMPEDDFIPEASVRGLVRDWILNGGQNN